MKSIILSKNLIRSILIVFMLTMFISGISNQNTYADEVPVGSIIMWSGSISNIPDGWHLCNGTNGTPDLRNRFVVGAGDSYNVGDKGGINNNDITHNHSIGSHTHDFSGTTDRSYSIAFVQSKFLGSIAPTENHVHSFSGTTDSSSSNTSNAGSSNLENRPPYYAVAYIMKTSSSETGNKVICIGKVISGYSFNSLASGGDNISDGSSSNGITITNTNSNDGYIRVSGKLTGNGEKIITIDGTSFVFDIISPPSLSSATVNFGN